MRAGVRLLYPDTARLYSGHGVHGRNQCPVSARGVLTDREYPKCPVSLRAAIPMPGIDASSNGNEVPS